MEVLVPGRPVTVPQPDIVLTDDGNGAVIGVPGRPPISSERRDVVGIHGRWLIYVIERNRRDLRICHLGGGLYTSARFLDPYASETVILEIEQGIADYGQRTYIDTGRYNWRIVVGDYRTTLPLEGMFDVILFDDADVLDRNLVKAHIVPGGMLLHGDGTLDLELR